MRPADAGDEPPAWAWLPPRYWDLTAKGFNNKTMLHSSYGVAAVTTAVSAAFAMYSLPPRRKKE